MKFKFLVLLIVMVLFILIPIHCSANDYLDETDAKESVSQGLIQDTNSEPLPQIKQPIIQQDVRCQHLNVKITSIIEPTCSSNGYTGNIVCSECGLVLKKGTKINQLAHIPQTVNQKEPTCASRGYSGDIICEICNHLIESGRDLDLLPHETEKLTQFATCEEFGFTGRLQCKNCGAITDYGEQIKPLGHKLELINVINPTCTKGGYSGDWLCTICNKIIVKNDEHEIDPLGHEIITINYKAATCTEQGFTGTKKCNRCGEIIDQGHSLIPLNHNITEVRSYKAATTSATGYTGDTYCSLCGILLSKGKEIARIVSNDDAAGKYDWQYTNNALYPLTYKDDTLNIKIDKVWYHRAWCYVAQIEVTDYTRFYTYCANNKYGSTSSTSKTAKQLGAILATNGCYSAPKVHNTTVRRGVIYEGAGNTCNSPVFYNSYNGLMGSAAMLGINKMKIQDAVDQHMITDTFCFGPAFNMNGSNNDGGCAQRTTIGTDGQPGHIVLVVSEGRYSDGVSAGLNYQECCDVIKHYGCVHGAPLDGGGSSTMVFQGQILNHVNPERAWLVDFVIVK